MIKSCENCAWFRPGVDSSGDEFDLCGHPESIKRWYRDEVGEPEPLNPPHDSGFESWQAWEDDRHCNEGEWFEELKKGLNRIDW